MRHNATIETLDLSDNSIESADDLAEMIRSNTTLQSLMLEDNQLGDAGMTNLAASLQENQTLQELCLRSNGIGSAGATALAAALSQSTNSLRVLNLSRNSIDDNGAISLAQALSQNNKCQLETLNLYKNTLGIVGANALVQGLRRNLQLEELQMDTRICCNDNSILFKQVTNLCRRNGFLKKQQQESLDPEEAARLLALYPWLSAQPELASLRYRLLRDFWLVQQF